MSSIYEERFDDAADERAEALQLGQEFIDSLPQDAPPPEPSTVEGFSPKIAEDVYGLLYLGKLEEEFDLYGHRFRIKTLNIDEELEANLLIDRWKNSTAAAQGRAYATALVAASIVSLDDKPLTKSLGPRDDTLIARFKQVNQWYWAVVEEIYQRFVTLERRQLDSLKELQKKRGGRSDDGPPDDSL